MFMAAVIFVSEKGVFYEHPHFHRELLCFLRDHIGIVSTV